VAGEPLTGILGLMGVALSPTATYGNLGSGNLPRESSLATVKWRVASERTMWPRGCRRLALEPPSF